MQHFTTSEGLSSNTVNKLFQDSKNFIWIVTDAGVSRYDGTKFTHYRKQEGLSTNEIFDIKEDSSGRIWFFHSNATLDFFQNNFIHNPVNTPFLDSLKSNDVFKQIYEDKDRTLYFYLNSQKIIKSLDVHNHVTSFQLPSIPVKNHFRPHTSEGMSIRYMKRNDDGEFNFWTPGGFFTTKHHFKKVEIVSSAYRYREILTSSNGKKYVISRNNDSIDFVVRKFDDEVDLSKNKILPNTGSNYILSILEDNNGFLWIVTFDRGVFCFQDDKLRFHFDIRDAKSIIQDNENNIWICSLKEGAYKISPFYNHHQHFERSLFNNSGIAALSENDTTGLALTNGNMLFFMKKENWYKLDFQQTEKSFNQILQVNSQLVLVGETGKLPYALKGIRFNETTKTVEVKKIIQSPIVMNRLIYSRENNEVSSFRDRTYLVLMNPEDLFSKMKFAAIGEQIFNSYYNSKYELIINAKKNYSYANKTRTEYQEISQFNGKKISDHLNLDSKTELFNIEGDSLFVFNNNRMYNLTAEFEQPIDLLIKHIAYGDSTLYIATSRNVYICRQPLNILVKQPVKLSLIDINFKSIHDILLKKDKLYIATDDGLTAILCEDLRNSSVHAPIPYFQSIQVNDQERLFKKDPISMMSNQRINITFGCINYTVSPNIVSYKLEGSDAGWATVKGNDLVLQNLPKGKYTFKLRARKPASPWSEPIEFTISVKLPIWQHPLFYFSVALFISVIVILLILRQKNAELARRQMEHQILQLEQKSHQAMMNPHFIFNVLGSIQNYLLRNKPNEAGIYLSQFARLIRQNLNALNASMINLEEEINRLKDYLDLEKLRMGDKFDFAIHLDENLEIEEIMVPSMIIQPFVENSIWHGIANLDDKGIIGISFQLIDEKSLRIIVEDSGIGIRNAEKYSVRSEQHLRLGMNITKKRLALLSQKYGTESSIIYSERSPGTANPGTIVRLVVPFIYGKPESPDSGNTV